MSFIKNDIIYILFLGCFLLCSNCVTDKNFDTPNRLCEDGLKPNITIEDLKNKYKDEIFQIQEDLILEAIVVSSDKEGNFFSVLHCQDKYESAEHGIQIEIELQDSHLFYPVGSKIMIKLKGLYFGKNKGLYKIGGVFTSFGNISIGRLPALSLKQHLFISCTKTKELKPKLVTISEINNALLNTLITINDIEFSKEILGLSFAEKERETGRTLEDCEDNRIIVLNSGYSNFQEQIIPSLRGSITGVLSRDSKNYYLIIRSLDDIDFTLERCKDNIGEFTSTAILISELADPDNNSSGRYIELYNASETVISLKGWLLQRFTNSNTEISSEVDLSDLEIRPNSTIILAPNAEYFNSIYGFLPDLEVGANSPADSNGDDNFILLDPFGTIIDVFGVVGQDGSDTNHEFEDGRALRRSNVLKGNSIYTPSEWIIINDTGGSGTINNPQMAPDDYTPGKHN
ncbi:DUF5689 domain-containing protein [uncultured Maribacter sp.]|uniref:DUF5689 domain-containing protein n=1 Tax=uncultured Maribacter sp. TaxID=431308 RepID=UPI00260689A4|nr:DUF5689 domain-containing protein [uncultured Maribacter sp.]